MSNALDEQEQQQICALGRLGWPLLRIQRATGVRRETVSGYLKAAGIPVRGRGRPSEGRAKPAITEAVSTDSATKTGNFPAGGVHRLAADARPECERLRAVPRAD